MIKLGVLISGTGTNLVAIQEAIQQGKLDASIELVISSRPKALGLKKAHNMGLQTMSLSSDIYDLGKTAADEIITSMMKQKQVDYIVMAGYMRKVGEVLLNAFPDKVLNLHPALLPSFPGARAIEQAWLAGVKVTGVTVHFANEHYDQGPIIAQRAISIPEGADLSELEALVHEQEHILYPEVLQLLAEDKISIMGDRTVRIFN